MLREDMNCASRSGSALRIFSGIFRCCSNRCSFWLMPTRLFTAAEGLAIGIVLSSRIPQNPSLGPLSMHLALWTYSEWHAGISSSLVWGMSCWCTGIHGHYYPEFGITAIMPKKILCRRIAGASQPKELIPVSSA